MNKDFIRAMQKWDAAKPESGFRPETPEEWEKVHLALEEMGFAILRKAGLSIKKARALARATYGGPAGLLLLDMVLREESHE